MKAYVIVEVSIVDKIIYEEYKKLTPAAIAAFDGKFGDRYYYAKFKILPQNTICFLIMKHLSLYKPLYQVIF